MNERAVILDRLVALSQSLAQSDRDLVILSEGNTSAWVDDETFLVKASGAQLGRAAAGSFVEVRFDRSLALLDSEGLDDEAVRRGLAEACVRPGAAGPSIETFLHALALAEAGARWVGHTHPTSVNSILCSAKPTTLSDGSLFPDAIVVYGPHPIYVPYADPGLPLARAVRSAIREHFARWNEPVKLILLQNHGMIALGQTPEEVENISSMAEKAARVLLGTFALGGPHYMAPEHVARIHSRPDEHLRRRQLSEDK